MKCKVLGLSALLVVAAAASAHATVTFNVGSVNNHPVGTPATVPITVSGTSPWNSATLQFNASDGAIISGATNLDPGTFTSFVTNGEGTSTVTINVGTGTPASPNVTPPINTFIDLEIDNLLNNNFTYDITGGPGIAVLEQGSFVPVSANYSDGTVTTPEPGTFALMGLAGIGLGVHFVRRRRRQAA